MKRLFSLFTLGVAAGAAVAAPTSIAQLPLLNISGTGTVRPNLMLLYDNSGSMGSNFTPDYVNDSTSCRARATMSGGIRACAPGDPPFNSADFNKQYYDPRVLYSPPVRSDGTAYPSMTRAATTSWTVVTTDGFGVNKTDFLNKSVASSNLVTGFPDLAWCDSTGTVCRYNTVSYNYPSDTYYGARSFTANPYYYTINVAEYCTDASMTTCRSSAINAAPPAGYPVAAKVRWCDSRALTNCQAKYVGNFKYPRFGDPNRAPDWFGTITIGASAYANAATINSVSAAGPNGTFVITSGAVSAPNGTNTAANQNSVAIALAASIIAKTGLDEQYTACVNSPGSSGVPACSTFAITLPSANMVAVVPVDCPAGAVGKSSCTAVTDGSRAGRDLMISSGSSATALLTVSGTSNPNTNEVIGGIKLGATQLLARPLTLAKGANSAAVAAAIKNAIGTVGTVTAYIGGTSGTPALCASASISTVCLVDRASGAGGANISYTAPTNNSSGRTVYLSFTTTSAVTDGVPASATPLGGSVFARTDIVPTRTDYPKVPARTDCAGATCTYDEEMTNFANWYAYYKTRNQMMKSAVGQAFRPLTDNYNVGIVSLSSAAAEGTMIPPKRFTGADRDDWYRRLYAMTGSSSTPLRPALHAIGKMYANKSPYVQTAGSEVVQLPCQQNFTFVTTDGYWNGNAAADVVNNDNVENARRFCTRSKGCVDPAAQTGNSLADVALYWYNGGSNAADSSLRPELEDFSKPGLVPAAPGENTRLHMNTYALGLGVDGIMTYEPNYDGAPIVGGDFYRLVTGATGCPWNGGGTYAWPDPKTGDTSTGAAYQSRVDDLWHAAINGHGKYFSASDPRQVVDGLSAALSNIEVKIGAAAAAATSTPNISQQDNDIFSATFTTVKWYGELTKRKIDTVTGVVGKTALWNSSDIVGRAPAGLTDEPRKILYASGGSLDAFDYARMTPAEQAWFDNKCGMLSQCATLSASDRAIVNDGANIVNWLKGDQTYANDTVLRAYTKTGYTPEGLAAPLPIVLGDIASSKPAYMREPRKGYTLAGYAEFKSAHASRRATVFVAANDGMLHAFDSETGGELWAYVPRITMSKLYRLANTNYGTSHQFTVDGSPEVADVQRPDGTWRTVLVGGMNAGGRGYFALDVTDPAAPEFLWELCADSAVCGGANNEAELGLTFGNPQFGTWKDGAGTHWVVFLTSGYNNVPGTDGVAGGSGKGCLFVVDVSTGRVLAKVSTGAGDTTTPSGLAKITAITANPATDPLVTYVYGGDVLGQMWRFDFTDPAAAKVLKMSDAGAGQPITTRPDVALCQVGAGTQRVVAFGTGRLLDVPDVHNTDLQSAYVLKDDGNPIAAAAWRDSTSMVERVLARTGSGGAYATSSAPVDLAAKRGWFVDFDQNAGERVNLDPKIVAGGLNIVTNVPSSSSDCSLGGTSNVYQFDVCTAKPLYDVNDSIAGGTLSNTSAAVGFIIVRLPSGAMKMITTTADGNTITSGVAAAKSQDARKAGWRRVRE